MLQFLLELLHPVIRFLERVKYSYLEFISENPGQYSCDCFLLSLFFSVCFLMCLIINVFTSNMEYKGLERLWVMLLSAEDFPFLSGGQLE